jgi:hypothetical protein
MGEVLIVLSKLREPHLTHRAEKNSTPVRGNGNDVPLLRSTMLHFS